MVEKIKQALERAYKERTGAVGRTLQVEAAREGFSIPGDEYATLDLKGANECEIDTRRFASKRIITFDNSDDSVESYRLLRTQLIQKMQSENLKTIGITSPNANEGKTLTSINLAISLAKTADIDVILVDGDISNPTIHDMFGISSKKGFVDLLKDDAELSEVLLKLNIPNLWLLPGRLANISLLDQTNPNKIEHLIRDLTVFDESLVLVDLPPVLSKDDTLAISACLSGVILVVQEGSTKTDEVSRSVELLKQGNLIGTVMNKYSRNQKTYY